MIVATTKREIQYLDRLHTTLQDPILNDPTYSPSLAGVPTFFLAPTEARRMEPDLGENIMCAMLSTESGIVDSHALMESLEADVTKVGEGEGQGSVALGTRVVRIDPYRGENGQFFFLFNIFPPVLTRCHTTCLSLCRQRIDDGLGGTDDHIRLNTSGFNNDQKPRPLCRT
jgi:hypothetical protein